MGKGSWTGKSRGGSSGGSGGSGSRGGIERRAGDKQSAVNRGLNVAACLLTVPILLPEAMVAAAMATRNVDSCFRNLAARLSTGAASVGVQLVAQATATATATAAPALFATR